MGHHGGILIALATTFSKLYECFILHQIEPFLTTADNQFGFKTGHSADMGVFLLKQSVSSYVKYDTQVFSVFLDTSKAFDRINDSKLFKKLIMQEVPSLHVLFVCLIIGTAIKTMQIKCDNCVSQPLFLMKLDKEVR